MDKFWVWLLISIGAGLLLFPASYFYGMYEDKKEGVIVSKKKNIQLAGIMAVWPVLACVITWVGIWFNL